MNDEMRIDTLLSKAAAELAEVSDSPRLDAELLLSQCLDVRRSYLFAHPEDQLDGASLQRFAALLNRRASGEPIAYLQGSKEFWSLTLLVTPATLVPRPETEILVQHALDRIRQHRAPQVLDLGTGSGAIALAIAKDRPDAQISATDMSGEAIAVATENARQLDIPNVRFVTGDWLRAVPDTTFDVVVSNPPYVRADDDALDALAFEPRAALVSGEDGLDDIRTIARDSRGQTRPGGSLLLEHGAEQAEAVQEILRAAGWQNIECFDDYAGLPRVTAAIRRD